MNILFNNSIVSKDHITVDLEDRGYQFGDGVYEVIRIYDGMLFEWDAHLERLFRSARELRIDIPVHPEKLYRNIETLIENDGVTEGSIYVQITRGIAPRSHAFPKQAAPLLTGYINKMARPLKLLTHGIKTITADDIRWLRVDIKSLNLLGNVLAKQKAAETGAEEAILVRDGFVTEGSSSNLFAIRGNECLTHPANHLILNGITRQVVLRLLKDTNLILREMPFSVSELLEMDEVFITSTGHEVCPVIEIDGRLIGNGLPGEYSRQLQTLFESFALSRVIY